MSLVFWFCILSLFFLVAILALIILLYKKKLLKKRVKEFEYLLQSSLDSERNDRKRIVDKLHDKLQGDLIAIKNFIYIQNQLKDENDKQALSSSIQLSIGTAIDNAKVLSYELMPPIVEQAEFIELIEDYLTNISKTTGKNFGLRKFEPNFLLPNFKSYELFRIIQFFCHFVSEQQKATVFLVELYWIDGCNYVELIDDGTPFEILDSYQSLTENNMKGILSRLKILNAELIQLKVVEGNHFIIKVNN